MRKSVGVLLALPVLLAGCGSSGGSSDGGAASGGASGRASTTPSDDVTGTLTVFAAASLTDVFGTLGTELEKEHPGLTVTFNFAGSQALAAQITQGAPADVFASANQAQMDVVTKAGLQAGTPTVFTENVLEIAVPAGNPGKVTGLADFADADLTLAVCAPDVPCGAAAQQVFTAAGITPRPDSEEEDVKAALTKVQLGEVDAALVYATDVRAAGSKVQGIEFPEAGKAVNTYPITTVKGAPNPAAAAAFEQLVEGPTGQRALQAAGFRAPAS